MGSERELQANIAPFGLRMQAELKERVQRAAERNNRSMNAEIVATLEDRYPPLLNVSDYMRAILEAPTDQEAAILASEATTRLKLRSEKLSLRLTIDDDGNRSVALKVSATPPPPPLSEPSKKKR